MARDDVVELETVEDLQRFFAEFERPERSCVFDGVDVTLEERGIPGTEGPAAFGGMLGGLGGLAGFGGKTRAIPGVFARVTLPRQVASDLLLRTKDRPKEDEESLDACFQIEASDREALEDYLDEGLGETLIRLNRTLTIEMDAEMMIVGPFEGGTADSAHALADLIGNLPRPSEDELDMPDFDETAARDGGVTEAGVRNGPVNAELARAALAAEGIPSRAVGTGGGIFGAAFDSAVRIVVPSSLAERAAKILEQLDAGEGEEEGEEEDEGDEPEDGEE